MRTMRLAILPIILGLLLLPAAGSAVAAQRWIPFDAAESVEPVDVYVDASSERHVVVDFDLAGMMVADARREERTFQRLHIQGGGFTSEIGKPELPLIGRFISLPLGADAQVEVIASDYQELDGYDVYPAQEPLPDAVGFDDKTRTLKMDAVAYKRNSYYPAKLADLEPINIRGRSLAILRVYPVQYNPVTKKVRTYSDLRVKVSFGNVAEVSADQRLRASAFDRMIDNLVINGSDAVDPIEVDSVPENEGSFLIITHPDFLAAAETLKNWKIKKGFHTVVGTTADIGGSADEIKTYIQNAYDSWENPPAFVLFIGDAEFVPTNYKTNHPYNPGLTATDLYYATVDGSDYFADIHTGRLSVDTPEQAAKRIADIINYEKAIVTDPDYYENAAVCAYFQDSNHDDTADRRFAQTSEDIALFLSSDDYLGAYAVDRIYTTHSNTDPQKWGNWFGGGPAGDKNAPIPAYLKKPGFAWDGDRYDISTAVNAGRFLVTHRDHGSMKLWGDPYYTVDHVAALTNGDKLPVVWSVNCQTGWFDNETDDNSSTGFDTIHFSEAWERNPDGGAVGIIASTRVSYSGHNDRLVWGWMDAIWPDFVPSYNSSAEPIWTMGQVLNYGKAYYATTYGDTTTRKIEFEMFHWFGDPTMQIWTAEPQELVVTHQSALGQGATSIDVTVEQDDAMICVSSEGEILGKALSQAGVPVTIDWSTPIGLNDTVDITVTKHNFRPFEASLGTSFIEIVSVSTGKPYGLTDAVVGAKPYIDRDYTVTSLSSGLQGGALVKTAMDDKYVDVPAHLVLKANADALVYVAYDKRGYPNVPVWLNSWTKKSETVSTTDAGASPMVIYVKPVMSGKSITLGGNKYGGGAGSGSNYFVIATPFAYCASQANNQNYEWIAGVKVGYKSYVSGPSPYSDFTSTVFSAYKGKSTAITLTPGYGGSAYLEKWRVWIDLNQDGSFSLEEKVYEGQGTGALSGAITVPTTAKTGNTRMRVSMSWGSYAPFCGNFTYGEVEDYTVRIKSKIIWPKVPKAAVQKIPLMEQ